MLDRYEIAAICVFATYFVFKARSVNIENTIKLHLNQTVSKTAYKNESEAATKDKSASIADGPAKDKTESKPNDADSETGYKSALQNCFLV